MGVLKRRASASAPTLGRVFLISDGDSRTAGYTTGGMVTPYPKVFADGTAGRVVLSNISVAGSTLATVISRRESVLAAKAANPGYDHYVYSLMIGRNDITTPAYYPSNYAGYVSDLAAHTDIIRANGFKIVLCTEIDSDLVESFRLPLNSGYRSLYPSRVDMVCDYGADPYVGADGALQPSATPQRSNDQVHQNGATHVYMASRFGASVNALSAI